MTVHVPTPKTIDSAALAQLFNEARTHNAFLDAPVSDELLKKAVNIAKMAPTSVNQSPLRVLFLRSKDAKERLRPALAAGNVEKTMKAPVVAVAAPGGLWCAVRCALAAGCGSAARSVSADCRC